MVPDTDVINIIEEEQGATSIKKMADVSSLKDKITRINGFLQELKVLSHDCQDLEQNQEDKERQVFNRRTIQVGAEIQDARDLLSAICKHGLPDRQWRLLFEATEADQEDTCLSGFDIDPSVQFFGIDWERVFGRCFGLSMHAKLLEASLMASQDDESVELDLVLINKMLRELAAIEADVLSHSEAVLRGRLSKSQRKLIFDEQLKYAALSTNKGNQLTSGSSVSKSRSFRDSSGKSRPIKYKKNKTTNLDKLTSSMSAHTLKCSSSGSDEEQFFDKKPTVVSISPLKRKSSSGSNGNSATTTSSSFMQNVTSIFKNIR